MKNHVTTRWFGDWANEYDATLGKVRRHHQLLDLAARLSGVTDGDRVLDVGCGTGLLSLKFLKRADCRVTAVDNSPDMRRLFQAKIDALGLRDRVRCARQDAAKLRFGKSSFDIIAATVALHHVENKRPMLKTMRSILKPGGRLVIGEVDVDTTGDHADPKRLARILDFLKDEIVEALKEGGVPAFSRMYDNGKKHILNLGEYCVSAGQWRALCLRAGFRRVTIHDLRAFRWFKVVVAVR
ncbi:MAG TPA: methyltransferase domain-containing protein [Kiritimatiellia bacterium]|nr:methyltransferase domain-containing protein [Kiritimatiellia bacterium]HRZ11171.1 methyltransferase domain-containing protein [Kiritimatiellia bacterium]HSA19022.1 methyltransferase domain-containing protein [Kiritimatiellia bacterium]